jgi:cell division protein FtsZ
MFEFVDSEKKPMIAKIKVIGIGGAGGNTINSMIDAGFEGITFIAANTDSQALERSKAHHKLQLGIKSTKGLGAGANPEVGKRAAEEDLDKLLELVEDADIVFLTAGMGGGTGSGGLPVIAQSLKEHGILTIAIVTKPFGFEGKKRSHIAQDAIEKIKSSVDTLLIMPNQKLLELVESKITMIDAFNLINNVLIQSVKGIADIIAKPGHINVDFADVRTIMKDMGLAVMGTGRASGEDRAYKAALDAISSPLLENMNIEGARGILLNISGGPSLGLHEISTAASAIYEQADEQANIIIGSVIDETLGDDIIITVIATGFIQKKELAVVQEVHGKLQPTLTDADIQELPKKELFQVKNESRFMSPEVKTASKGTTLVETQSLEVPTFMRKQVQQQEHNHE